MAPDGVSICAITSNVEHWDKENFKQAVIDPLVALSRYLASRNVDYIPVVTTWQGFEEELVKIITDATVLPASTSIRSAIRALAYLRIEDVVVVSPYPQELHHSALAFLQASGFKIVAEHTEDVVFKHLQDVTPSHIAADEKLGAEGFQRARAPRPPFCGLALALLGHFLQQRRPQLGDRHDAPAIVFAHGVGRHCVDAASDEAYFGAGDWLASLISEMAGDGTNDAVDPYRQARGLLRSAT